MQDTLCYRPQQDRPIAREDLSQKIACWESEQPHSEVSAELVNEILELLEHDYIPKLVELGLVEREHEYDENYLTVTEKIEIV